MTYQNDASLFPHYSALRGSVLMIEVLCLDTKDYWRVEKFMGMMMIRARRIDSSSWNV